MPVNPPEQHFRWQWDFVAPPEALWPLVSNTDRFNRDCGYPSVSAAPAAGSADGPPGVRRLRTKVQGLTVEWDEHPFEWQAPRSFGVERVFHRGPVARLTMRCELLPRSGGGTQLTYELRIVPANLVGRLALPWSIGRRARAITERVLRHYDERAQQGLRTSRLAQSAAWAPGGRERLAAVGAALVNEARQPTALVERLNELITAGDDLTLGRLRPYAIADEWREERRATLDLFLHATRAGALDFSWDLVCPHCRGATPGSGSLDGISASAHCPSCQVDFTANFDQSVELTFVPNPSIRTVTRLDYCVGGPQLTPHVIAQQRLGPGERRTLPLQLTPGRYRARAAGIAEQHAFRVMAGAAPRLEIPLGVAPTGEPPVGTAAELTLGNVTAQPCVAVVEELAWSDQAATAAEVTARQLFRDLFSREVLRPGERISVGTMTVVFTDLKNSTQMYQEIGDAPAFGRVLTHFEILKAAVAAEDGAIVKTMGDAIMAVFRRPLAALRALRRAQRWLAEPARFALPAGVTVPASTLQPLALKAGLHCGPCLAITQNDRLDYFGTTVNIAARLCGLSTGRDVVISSAVDGDHEVRAAMAEAEGGCVRTEERTTLKGFGAAEFAIWRLAGFGD